MKSQFSFITVLALATLGVCFEPGLALAENNSATEVTANNAAMSEGSVKKLDVANGKITIKHGPLVNLGMQPMTMTFKAGNGVKLDQIKPGDKVRFMAEEVGGVLTVTRIEVAK